MEPQRQSFSGKLRFYLTRAEQALLAIALIGLVLRYADMPATTVLTVSLSGLAVVFFLSAFLPPDQVDMNENAPLGLKELLVFTIAPKILGIACAVSAVGILFFLQGLRGYQQMIMVGGSAIIAGILILGVGFITNTKNIKTMMPMLHRGIPLALVDAYIFLQNT